MEDNTKLILIVLLGACIGFLGGFAYGVKHGINTCVDIGLRITGLEIDPALAKQLLDSYGAKVLQSLKT